MVSPGFDLTAGRLVINSEMVRVCGSSLQHTVMLCILSSQMTSRSFRVHLEAVTDQTFALREQPCVLEIFSELDFGSLVVTLLLVFTFGCLLTEVTAR